MSLSRRRAAAERTLSAAHPSARAKARAPSSAHSMCALYPTPPLCFWYEYQNKGVTGAVYAKNINLKDLVAPDDFNYEIETERAMRSS